MNKKYKILDDLLYRYAVDFYKGYFNEPKGMILAGEEDLPEVGPQFFVKDEDKLQRALNKDLRLEIITDKRIDSMNIDELMDLCPNYTAEFKKACYLFIEDIKEMLKFDKEFNHACMELTGSNAKDFLNKTLTLDYMIRYNEFSYRSTLSYLLG